MAADSLGGILTKTIKSKKLSNPNRLKIKQFEDEFVCKTYKITLQRLGSTAAKKT